MASQTYIIVGVSLIPNMGVFNTWYTDRGCGRGFKTIYGSLQAGERTLMAFMDAHTVQNMSFYRISERVFLSQAHTYF